VLWYAKLVDPSGEAINIYILVRFDVDREASNYFTGKIIPIGVAISKGLYGALQYYLLG
jgi:hypothetical protein